jgi:hypothetical protein
MFRAVGASFVVEQTGFPGRSRRDIKGEACNSESVYKRLEEFKERLI